VVGGELVDRVEHEGTEDRYAGRDQAQVRPHVGEQLDLQRGDRAVLLRRDGEVLDLVASVVRREK
jgi:hypothetical protein